jgi:hypothetical protein
VGLPEVEWWEVFDVGREELGFLVVAIKSTGRFVEEQERRRAEAGGEGEEGWRRLLTVEGVRREMGRGGG